MQVSRLEAPAVEDVVGKDVDLEGVPCRLAGQGLFSVDIRGGDGKRGV